MYGNGFKKTKRKTGRTEQQKLVKKLDTVFSLFIRLRDAMPNGFFRCISCGQIKPFAQADCGHFHRRELMSTRFDERNCNAECRFCNRMKADHLIDYQKHLIEKIGKDEYDKLYILAHSTKHWMVSELKDMIKYYTALTEELRRRKGL